MPRRRFQKGMMVIRGTKHPQRCGLYREDILLKDGTLHRVRRTVRLGPVSELSERAARAKFQPYLDRVNSAVERPPKSGITLQAFVQEWRANIAGNLEASTVRAAESHLRAHIIPILGALRLVEMNPKVIQAFVTSMATSGLSRKTVEMSFSLCLPCSAPQGHGVTLAGRSRWRTLHFPVRESRKSSGLSQRPKQAALSPPRRNRSRQCGPSCSCWDLGSAKALHFGYAI